MGKEVLERLERVLRLGGGVEETSVAYMSQTTGATRFASNRLTQCVQTVEPLVEIRAIVNGSLGIARTSSMEGDSLARAHSRAIAVAGSARGLASGGFPEPAPTPIPRGWEEDTARTTAMDRVSLLRPVFQDAERRSLQCAGVFVTSEIENAVVSSRGIRSHQVRTQTRFEVIASDGDACGYAGSAHRSISALDVREAASRAMEKAERARSPQEIAPGVMDVVLEPPAVREILEWLSFTSLHARAIEDGTSALAGRIGERLFGENVTLVEDPLCEKNGASPRAFDVEGVPARRVDLIAGGVARGVVSDFATASRLGTASTGNAAPLGDELNDAPSAGHLHLAPGEVARPDLLRRMDRGLLITRFHYVNGLLDTRRAVMTGLTRDGVFWVENGEILQPVRNLRWTQSMVEAFRRVESISREVETSPTWWQAGGAYVVPSLLIRGWNFNATAA